MADESASHAMTPRLRQLKRHQWWAFVMGGVALTAAAALRPSGDELLLIHVRNNDIGRARAVLADTGTYGVSSPAAVAAHAELFLYEGKVDETLGEVERYLDAHPRDAGAWTRLAQLYGHAQRMNDQTRALTELYRIAPSHTLARDLAARLRVTGDAAGEAALLRDLARDGQATAGDYLRSARLEAALGHPRQSLAALDALRTREPGAFDYPALELYGSLMLDQHGTGLLAERLQTLPLLAEDPEALARLSVAMTSWGRPDAAVALFASRPGVPAVPAFAVLRMQTAKGTPEAVRVVRESVEDPAFARLGLEPRRALVNLALSVADYGAVSWALGIGTVPPPADLLASAVGYAVSHGARPQAQALITAHGDDALRTSPLLALELAVERGDLARAAYWIAAAEASPEATPETFAGLAQFEVKIGAISAAYERLAALVATSDVPAWAFSDFSGLALRLGRASDALATLAAAADRAPEARAAWARLAIESGSLEAIDAWFASRAPRAPDAAALRDIYYMLSGPSPSPLALRAAERLLAASTEVDDQWLAAQALLTEGRPAEALTALRSIQHVDARAYTAYESALLASALAGHDVSVELRDAFRPRLADAGIASARLGSLVEGLWAVGERAGVFDALLILAGQDLDRWLPALVESARAAGRTEEAVTMVARGLGPAPDPPSARNGLSVHMAASPSGVPSRAESLVHVLLDLDAAPSIVLPHLRALAFTQGGTWVYAYDERLARQDDTAARVELWSAAAQTPGSPAADRRAAAARLVDLGAIPEAAEALQGLAAEAAPTHPDVQQLLALWGANPGEAPLAWLEQRLRRAQGHDQAAWIAHLVAMGGARRVLGALPVLPSDAQPPVVDAWLDAHRAAQDRERLGTAVGQVLALQEVEPAQLRRAGHAALAEGMPALAREAFGRVASAIPTDLEALRWLGTLTFYTGHLTEARDWLRRYVALGGGEAEPLYQFGELALADGWPADARAAFTRARDRLTAADDQDTASRALLGNVLVRLDARDRAADTFEHLLAVQPVLHHVRADYVVALLRWGRFGEARRVLDATPAAAGVTPPAMDDGGATRLDLLRVQWLVTHGRYREAQGVLDVLGARRPSDPDVLLARARFDIERGRVADADHLIEQAGHAAPGRDEIAQLQDERARDRAPQASVQTDARTITNAWDEQSTRLLFRGRMGARLSFSVAGEQLRIQAPRVFRTDGSVSPLDTTVTRLDAQVGVPIGAASQVTAAVFGTSSGAGAGATLTRHDLRGATTGTAEFGRPFWEFLESAADDGRKDRLGLQRQWRIRPDTAAWTTVDWNRYRLGAGASLTSAAVGLGLVRTIRQTVPSLTLQYGLDKERRLGGTMAVTPDGFTFSPVPLQSREVHVFGAITRAPIRRLWDVEAAAGYALDRFGGRGSFLTVHAAPRVTARAGLELWAERRLFILATTQQAVRFGARGLVRF